MRGSQKEYWFGILGCFGVLLLLSRSVGVSARPLKELEKAKQEAPENHRRPVANFEVEAQTRVGSSSSRVLAATALSTTDDQVANPSSASRHDVDSVDSASATEETSGHRRSGNGIDDNHGEFYDSSKYRKYFQSEKQKEVLSLSSVNNYAKASCSSTSCNNGGDRMKHWLRPLSGSTSHRHGSTKTRTPNSTSCRRLLRQTDNPSQKTSFSTSSHNTEVGATRENNFREQEQRDDSYQIFSIAVGFREVMDEARMKGVVMLVLLAFCLRDIGRAVQKPWILQLRYFLETAAIYVLASQLIPTSWIPLSYLIIAFIFLLFGGIKRT
ncbi:hypothetical protein TIFTF001_002820 [Ficus carica]|uniref:Uncharacterized protein n=1 Tax=Ficus carica TaxID=3494 RepID=A0AA88CUA4_FICCA|nr:hypothetical protein TIFTF001_002820 [Ficus carica]